MLTPDDIQSQMLDDTDNGPQDQSEANQNQGGMYNHQNAWQNLTGGEQPLNKELGDFVRGADNETLTQDMEASNAQTENSREKASQFIANTVNDIENQLSIYASNAKSDLAAMFSVDIPDPTSDNPVPDIATYIQNRDAAQQKFVDREIKPILGAASFVFKPAAVAYLPFFGEDIYNSVKEKGVLSTLRDFTYGQAKDFFSQPDLSDQFNEKPFTTTVQGAMSVLAPFLMGKSAVSWALRRNMVLHDAAQQAQTDPAGAVANYQAGNAQIYQEMKDATSAPPETQNIPTSTEIYKSMGMSDIPSDSGSLADTIVNVSREENTDPNLMLAIAMRESGGDSVDNIKMSDGGGMFQIEPNTDIEVNGQRAKIADLYPDYQTDPVQNTKAAIAVLHDKIAQNDGNVWAGVKDYNGGGDPDYLDKVQSNYSSVNRTYLDSNGLETAASPWIGKTMNNGENGCVEAVGKIGSGYSDFLAEENRKGVVNVDQLVNDAGDRVIPFDENKLQKGDVIVYGDDEHVVVYDGKDGYFGNSTKLNTVVHGGDFHDMGGLEPTKIIKTPDNSFSEFSNSSNIDNSRTGTQYASDAEQEAEKVRTESAQQLDDVGSDADKAWHETSDEYLKRIQDEQSQRESENKPLDDEQAKSASDTVENQFNIDDYTDNPSEINNKIWYHGSGTEELSADKLTPNATKIEGLFGHGIYLTDNRDIASGYAKARSVKTGTPVIYNAKVNIGNALNLEKPLPNNAYNVFKEAAESIVDRYDYPEITNHIEVLKNKNGEDVYKTFSNDISNLSNQDGIPSNEFVEDFQDLSSKLKEAGYDAYTHIGGKRTGANHHQVLVMLDPNDELSNSGRSGQITNFGMVKTPDEILADHKAVVKQAIKDGKDVPDNVRAEYPDLMKEYNGPELSSVGSVSLSKNPAKNFVDQDVKPAAHSFLDAIGDSMKDVRDVLAPALAGKNAKLTADIMRENMAEMARKADAAEKTLQDARNYFAKQPEEAGMDFINRIETGKGQLTPQLQQFADTLRSMLDVRRTGIQELGNGKLQKFIENYFPHLWKDTKRADNFFASWAAKRPFEGNKSFLKKRSIPTTKDGIDMGLQPISKNPVDIAMLKMREMDKYIMAHKTINELKDRGLVTYIKATSTDIPDNYAKIDDRIGIIYGAPTVDVKEAYDPVIMKALNNTLDKIGVYHSRLTKIPLGKESAGVWGLADRGSEEVMTKFGGPESVLAHELGHQLAYKYGLDKVLLDDKTPVKIGGKEIPAGQEIKRELQILAEKRLDPNDMHQSELNYVHGGTEPIAAVAEAYAHAPEMLKELAPVTYERFKSFLDSHKELHEFRDIKPSLQLGENTDKQAIGGLVINGYYYMPKEAARLINNYLSPGLRSRGRPLSGIYRGYLGAANILNQFQLGLSAFHLGFTSMDATVSKIALGFIKTSHGDIGKALEDFAHAPIAPIENALRGNKVLKEWYTPGTQGAEIAKLADALVASGGRVQMDKFYRTGMWEGMKDAFKANNYLGGLWRMPFAVMDKAAKPIMEYIVPRQKLGVWADAMHYEMERTPDMTRDEMRQIGNRIWNSVDNRMGQLAYDNLFWNKTLKDLTMASVRSVGWNLGTFRELGGAGVDTAEQLGKIFKKGEAPEMTYKMSYALALPITVGLVGAITQYLYTGQMPQSIKDLYYPQTGTLDKNGKPQRVELPSYMKDVYAYYDHPGQTLMNKLHPMLSLIANMVENRDYYGTKIYNEDDNPLDELGEMGKYVLSQFIPYSLQGSKHQADLGGDVLSKVLPFFGITPAPSDVNQTPLERKMSDLIHSRMPAGTKTQAEADKSDLKRSILRDMQENGGKPTESLTDAYKNKGISHTDYITLKREGKLTPLERQTDSMKVEDLQALLPLANDDERPVIEKVLKQKISNAKRRGD